MLISAYSHSEQSQGILFQATIVLDVRGTFAYTPPSVCPVRPALIGGKENQQWDHIDKNYRWEDES
jgi:hypothetical protein